MVMGFRKRGPEPTVTEEAIASGTATGPAEAYDEKHGSMDGPNIATIASGSDTQEVRAGVDQLKKFAKAHQWDYNLDYDAIEAVNKVVDSGDTEKEANFEHTLLEEDSPYFEVRAAVRNYDE